MCSAACIFTPYEHMAMQSSRNLWWQRQLVTHLRKSNHCVQVGPKLHTCTLLEHPDLWSSAWKEGPSWHPEVRVLPLWQQDMSHITDTTGTISQQQSAPSPSNSTPLFHTCLAHGHGAYGFATGMLVIPSATMHTAHAGPLLEKNYVAIILATTANAP